MFERNSGPRSGIHRVLAFSLVLGLSCNTFASAQAPADSGKIEPAAATKPAVDTKTSCGCKAACGHKVKHGSKASCRREVDRIEGHRKRWRYSLEER
jgi:hypothetical protein